MQRLQPDDEGQGKEGCCGGRGCKEEAVTVTIVAIVFSPAFLQCFHIVHTMPTPSTSNPAKSTLYTPSQLCRGKGFSQAGGPPDEPLGTPQAF